MKYKLLLLYVTMFLLIALNIFLLRENSRLTKTLSSRKSEFEQLYQSNTAPDFNMIKLQDTIYFNNITAVKISENNIRLDYIFYSNPDIEKIQNNLNEVTGINFANFKLNSSDDGHINSYALELKGGF